MSPMSLVLPRVVKRGQVWVTERYQFWKFEMGCRETVEDAERLDLGNICVWLILDVKKCNLQIFESNGGQT